MKNIWNIQSEVSRTFIIDSVETRKFTRQSDTPVISVLTYSCSILIQRAQILVMYYGVHRQLYAVLSL